jgi:putative spermidine/putrescine transport system permease protein
VSATAGTGGEARAAFGPRPGAARGFRRARQRQAWTAFALAAPLLLFLALIFVLPIGTLLLKSVEGLGVQAVLPGTARALRDWNGLGLPDQAAYAALGTDLAQAEGTPALGEIARRLNFFDPGFRTLLLKTARDLPAQPPANWKDQLVGLDARWGDRAAWIELRRGATWVTPDYLLAAVDRKVDAAGNIVPVGEELYLAVFKRTFWISGVVTVLCFLFGYPVAYLLATLPAKYSARLLIFVIVPFWTSLLVRTTAWYVLLQPNGVVNSLLKGLGLTTHSIPLVFNRTGVLIGMTHILLPYMILANYAVMKGISPSFMRAALSLGSHPVEAFFRVYFPLTLPGVGAGTFLVFVLALGYYITPAMLGGGGDTMISQLIAFQTQDQLNWGIAGALSLYLVALTLGLYFAFNRLIGVERLRLG